MSASGDDRKRTEPRRDALRQLGLVQKWMEKSDMPHAAVHVAQAIASDPSLPEAYLELDRVFLAGGRSATLFGGAHEGFIGNVAARAHLAAGAGDLATAFGLMVPVMVHEPAKPWTETGWWSAAGSTDDPGAVGRALARCVPAIGKAADPASLQPFLALARRLTDARPDDIELAVAVSGVAGGLGAAAEGAGWCERAEKLTPGSLGSMMLGYALWAAKRYGETEAAWLRAIEADPANLDVQVDLAKLLIDQDRRADAERWLRSIAAKDPAHAVARALRFALRFRDNWDIVHLVALVDEARTGDREDAALEMLTWACDTRIWLNLVPMPTETAAMSARHVSRLRAEGKDISIERGMCNVLESPSAIAAATRVTPDIQWEVLGSPAPDRRVPLAPVTHQVWRYDGGLAAMPAVGPPSAAAAELLRDVANSPWPNPIAAYRQAARFAGTSLDDLLGLLCHMPPPPDNPRWKVLHPDNPSYWPRLAAAWVCVAILHHEADRPWAASTRRQVLIDLVNGVEDWTTDSALFALTVAAWTDPEVRSEVRGTVRERLDIARAASNARPVTIAGSIADLMLVTPGALPNDMKQAVALRAYIAKPSRRGISRLWRR